MLTKTVYSLYFPETREIVDTLWRERPHHLYEKNYTKRQDAMHGAFLAAYRDWVGRAGVTLGEGFAHEYPTAGASEGIQALLARIATSARPGTRPRVHVLDGEYEGYLHVAAALGLETIAHERAPDAWRRSLTEHARAGDWFFVSQPSAIDGCVWDGLPELVRWLADRLPEVEVAVDLTYVGSVAHPMRIDLSAPNVGVVLASLSKPFGVYYHRVGALLSRTPFASLYGNLWFKNLFSLALGERLLRAYEPCDLPARYAPLQRAVIQQAVAAGDAPSQARPSDVVLLACARVEGEPSARFTDFVRIRESAASVMRFCLTPALDALIAEKGST